MSKKTTKQLKEILMSQHEYWSQSSERIMDKINQQVEPEKPVFFIYYVEDGIPMIYSYCQKCGREEKITRSEFLMPHRCTCGNDVYKNWNRRSYARKDFFVPTKVVDDDYFCFVLCKADLQPCIEKKLPVEQQLKKPPRWTWGDCCIYGIFNEETGLLFVDGKGHYIRKTQYPILLTQIECAVKIDKELTQRLLPSMETFLKMQDSQKTLRQKKELAMSETMPIPDWVNNRVLLRSPSLIKNQALDGSVEHLIYCGQCKRVLDVAASSSLDSIFCPICGNEISHSNQVTAECLFYEADENGWMNVRHIKKTAILRADKTLESKTVELSRVTFKPGGIVVHEADKNEILRKTRKKLSSWIAKTHTAFCRTTEEEVLAEVNKTFLSRYGLNEAYKLNIWEPFSWNGIRFINTLSEIPQIELFVKCGMSTAARQLCLGVVSAKYDRSAKNICDFLGISKRVFNLSRKNNLGLVEIRLLNRMMKSDPSLTWETFKQIIDNHCQRAAVKINEDYGISYGKILDYLKRVDDYQCIPYKEAINIWHDYLSMATALKMPLHNKNVKFPTSLKKEHDRATYAYQAVKVEIDLERFHREVEKAQGLSYKGSKYLIRVPKEPEEIVAEGESLHHCVKTYISRVRDGETSIVFLRRVEEPDTPLYTIEVRNDLQTKEVVQIRGLSNRTMKETDMKKFVHGWCEDKGLCYR